MKPLFKIALGAILLPSLLLGAESEGTLTLDDPFCRKAFEAVAAKGVGIPPKGDYYSMGLIVPISKPEPDGSRRYILSRTSHVFGQRHRLLRDQMKRQYPDFDSTPEAKWWAGELHFRDGVLLEVINTSGMLHEMERESYPEIADMYLKRVAASESPPFMIAPEFKSSKWSKEREHLSLDLERVGNLHNLRNFLNATQLVQGILKMPLQSPDDLTLFKNAMRLASQHYFTESTISYLNLLREDGFDLHIRLKGKDVSFSIALREIFSEFKKDQGQRLRKEERIEILHLLLEAPNSIKTIINFSDKGTISPEEAPRIIEIGSPIMLPPIP